MASRHEHPDRRICSQFMHQQRAGLHIEDQFYTTSCDTFFGRLVVGIRRDKW
jgi:hypothetical protein